MPEKGRPIIYALAEPWTGARCSGEVRYVGRSSDGVYRPKAKHHAHCGAWMAKLKRWGREPTILVLQEFHPATPNLNDVLNAAEVFWIAELRRRGCPLTNLAVGGDGVRGVKPSPEALAKRSAALTGARNPRFGKKNTPEHRAAMVAGLRAACLGKPLSELRRAKISAAHQGKTASEESRAKMAAAQQGRKHSAETRAKMAASAAKAWKRRAGHGRVQLSLFGGTR